MILEIMFSNQDNKTYQTSSTNKQNGLIILIL